MKKENNEKKNQKSFYFKEYDHYTIGKTKNNKLTIDLDRVYLLFFVFFCLIFIFATKIFFISLKNQDSKNYLKNYQIFKTNRNGVYSKQAG